MAARADGVYDLAAIRRLAKEADRLADEIANAAGKIITSAAEMNQSPHLCKAQAETSMGLLAGIGASGKDLAERARTIAEAAASRPPEPDRPRPGSAGSCSR